MSWWDSSNFSKLASNALQQAQQKIDKVLDISEGTGGTPTLVGTHATEKLSPEVDGEFFNAWLPESPSSESRLSGSSKIKTERKGTLDTSKLSTNSSSATKAPAKSKSRIFSGRSSLKKIPINEKRSVSENQVSPNISKLPSSSSATSGAACDVKDDIKPEASNLQIVYSPSSAQKELTEKPVTESTGKSHASKDSAYDGETVLSEMLPKAPSKLIKKVEDGVPSTHCLPTEEKNLLSTDEVHSFISDSVRNEEIPGDSIDNESSHKFESDNIKSLIPPVENEIPKSPVVQIPEKSTTMQLTDSVVINTQESDWSDVSLSILTESQLSTTSSSKESTSTDSQILLKSQTSEGADGSNTTSVDQSNLSNCKHLLANQYERVPSDIPSPPESTETFKEDNTGYEKLVSTESILTLGHQDVKTDDRSLVVNVSGPDPSCDDDISRNDTSSSLCSSQLTTDTERTENSDTTDDLSESNRTLTGEEIETGIVGRTSESRDEEIDDATTTKVTPEHVQEITQKPDSGGSRGTMTASSSSSHMKNLLEEAMVESTKDTDSHSSSDMVRIGSGPNSGHTSADEIETTTSSDIEIISHISTPTSNGDFRIDPRAFEFSPLRHGMSRSMRRTSPPGHKRSDSGSSGYSLQSRNGDDLLSPDGQLRPDMYSGIACSAAEYENRALDNDKLLKPASPTPTLEVIDEQSTRIKVDDDDQRLAEMAEVLDAREKKLLQLSRENVDLVETNNIIRNQLQQSEEAREVEQADVKEITDEFTQRLTDAEKRLQTAIREKDYMKKRLQGVEAELAKKSSNSSSVEMMLQEKDQQITELIQEGEKLSKQQLQSNNILKKLRVKEKDSDSLIKTQKQKLDEQTTECERLEKILENKMDLEKNQIDAINQLNNAVKKQESEVLRLTSELEDSEEKIRGMQNALDKSYKEIAGLHKSNVAKVSEAQEVALSSAMQAKEELRLVLEKQKVQSRRDQEELVSQIEDLRLSIGRQDKDSGRREDMLRQEISDLQKRLQEAEERNHDLTQSVSVATRPLLRQIENLQATYGAQVASYERVERNLTERLSEAQMQLAAAIEKERAASEQVMEVTARFSSLETQIASLRSEKSRLQAQLEVERTKLEVLDETRQSETAELETKCLSKAHQISDLKRDNVMLTSQLEMETMKLEAEKKKLVIAHEQLSEKEYLLMQTPRTPPTRTPPARTPPAHSREGSISGDSFMSMSISQSEDQFEKTLMLASSNGSKLNLYDSLRQSSTATILESLQAQLKMREGEISQLQSEICELERTRESMARELVDLSNKKDELADRLSTMGDLKKQYDGLDSRYQALLQMYGEKVEEAEECMLDLQDVKDMYKSQLNELM